MNPGQQGTVVIVFAGNDAHDLDADRILNGANIGALFVCFRYI